MLKVTVTVETGRPKGGPASGETSMNRQVFHAEWDTNAVHGKWIAAHAEHKIAELGAQLVAQVVGVHGDLRDTNLYEMDIDLRGKPLADYAAAAAMGPIRETVTPTSPPMDLEALFADMRRRMEFTMQTIGKAVRDAQRIRREAENGARSTAK